MSKALVKGDDPPTSSYSSISSSSFFDLKAEVAKRQDDFTKSSTASTSYMVGRKRPSTEKDDIFSKKNRGLSLRLARDLKSTSQDLAGDGRDPARAKAQLEKKAQLYDQIRRGKTAGLSEDKIASLLVDFDKSNDDNDGESGSEYESSDDEDESLAVPQRPIEEDPLVEYTDELGRTRLIPKSEVPRSTAQDPTYTAPADEQNIHYGDQVHFPVYEPSPEELRQRAAALAAIHNEPLVAHYDASRENRAKGAGFYAFSGEERERERQMAALKREREETERQRLDGAGKLGGEERAREREERKVVLERKKEEIRRRKEERQRGA